MRRRSMDDTSFQGMEPLPFPTTYPQRFWGHANIGRHASRGRSDGLDWQDVLDWKSHRGPGGHTQVCLRGPDPYLRLYLVAGRAANHS